MRVVRDEEKDVVVVYLSHERYVRARFPKPLSHRHRMQMTSSSPDYWDNIEESRLLNENQSVDAKIEAQEAVSTC